MGISLQPNTTAAGTAATAPLPTEYPNAPSTTGTPQNRLQLAQNAWDTFAQSTAPQYTADLRQATQQAAGNGQEGSGQLRTTYGNLANQRALALDTERSNLINSATTATIGDQQTNRGLDISQQNANTSQAGTLGNLALATGEATGTVNGQQTLAARTADQQTAIAKAGLTGVLDGSATLQAKQDAVNQAVAQGGLTVAQGQLELARLTQATSASQGQQALDLSKLSEADQTALAKANLTGIMSDGSQTLAAKQAAIQNALAQGQLTNAQAQTAINALAQQSTATTQAGQLQLAQDQLKQAATQFGLSQDQQLKLANLANATQNRQIDVTSQQGQNALLVQLASIIGGPTGSLDPNFVQTIMKALGIAQGTNGNTATTGAGTGPGQAGRTPV